MKGTVMTVRGPVLAEADAGLADEELHMLFLRNLIAAIAIGP